MRRSVLLPVALVALLSACATPEERAAQVRAEVDDMIRVYGPGCEKLGYTKDTDLWRDCILRLSARANYRLRPSTTSCTGYSGFYNCVTY